MALHTSVAVGYADSYGSESWEATVEQQPESGTPATIIRNGSDFRVRAELSDVGESIKK
jgi:hypothetical protein